MKRVWILIVMLTMLSLTAFANSGKLVSINGYQMMPLDTFGDTFNADIDYGSLYNSIRITVGYHTVDLIPYSKVAWVDTLPVTLIAPVVIVDGVTYVPVDFLTDAFGIYRVNRDFGCVFYDPYVGLQIVILLDNDWGRRHHVWRYDYDCRAYSGFRHRVIRHTVVIPSRPPPPRIEYKRHDDKDYRNRVLPGIPFWQFDPQRDRDRDHDRWMGQGNRTERDFRWDRRDSDRRHDEVRRQPERDRGNDRIRDRNQDRDRDRDRDHDRDRERSDRRDQDRERGRGDRHRN